jgi:hypothetical protein
MATTALESFNIAMGLTDNLTDNADYLARAPYAINAILPELYQYSSTKIVTAGAKPTPTFVTSMSDALVLDDVLARGVLPHGMIAMLFTDDVVIANFHQQLYEQKLRKLSQTPVESEYIEDIYGGIGLYEE